MKQKHSSKFVYQAIPYIVALTIAVLLKAHYTHADAAALKWVLAPTSWCVEHFSGIRFLWESGIGYINNEHMAVIVPACAGVNFMIIAFCMISFMLLQKQGRMKFRLLGITAAIPAAFTATVIANAARIALAVYFYDIHLHYGLFTQERIHRLLGIVLYFFTLCSLYSILNSKRINRDSTQSHSHVYIRHVPVPQIIVPAMWYLAITLVVPLLLGKFSLYGSQLFEHALFLLFVPTAAILITLFGYYLSQIVITRGFRIQDKKQVIKTWCRNNNIHI